MNLGNTLQTYRIAVGMLQRNLTYDQRDYWLAVKSRALREAVHG